MKLSQIALVTVAAATCCVGLRAYQRVADFGFGNDDSPSNVKAEFYWSRLAYTSNMQSFNFGNRRDCADNYTVAQSDPHWSFCHPSLNSSYGEHGRSEAAISIRRSVLGERAFEN